MALTKQQKDDVVKEVAALLSSSKMTVVATYNGTTVKAMQQLRRDARDSGTKVRVVKNRLVAKALGQVDSLKDVDASNLTATSLLLAVVVSFWKGWIVAGVMHTRALERIDRLELMNETLVKSNERMTRKLRGPRE